VSPFVASVEGATRGRNVFRERTTSFFKVAKELSWLYRRFLGVYGAWWLEEAFYLFKPKQGTARWPFPV
jgi:hypothetical protein